MDILVESGRVYSFIADFHPFGDVHIHVASGPVHYVMEGGEYEHEQQEREEHQEEEEQGEEEERHEEEAEEQEHETEEHKDDVVEEVHSQK